MLKLVESEKQEIFVAFEEAEKAIFAASEAMQNLTKMLEAKMAYLEIKKTEHIRSLSIPIGASNFKLQRQRYKIQNMMKLDRAF